MIDEIINSDTPVIRRRLSARVVMDRTAARLGIKSMSDWYSISLKDAHIAGAGPFLKKNCGNSLVTALEQAYPDHSWQVFRFSTVPRGYWRSISHQKQAVDAAAEELGISTPSDWYSVCVRLKAHTPAIAAFRNLLEGHYKGSLFHLLSTLYPEHTWLESTFYDHPEKQRQIFDSAFKQLGLTSLEDWYKVAKKEACSVPGVQLVVNRWRGSLRRALIAVYPEHSFTRYARINWLASSEIKGTDRHPQ